MDSILSWQFNPASCQHWPFANPNERLISLCSSSLLYKERERVWGRQKKGMYERCQTEPFTWKGVRTWKLVLFCSQPIRLFYSIHLRYTCFFLLLLLHKLANWCVAQAPPVCGCWSRGVIDPPRSSNDLSLTRCSPAVDLEWRPFTLRRTHSLSLSHTRPHTCTKGKLWVRTSHLLVSSWLLALMWMGLRMKEGSDNIEQFFSLRWKKIKINHTLKKNSWKCPNE